MASYAPNATAQARPHGDIDEAREPRTGEEMARMHDRLAGIVSRLQMQAEEQVGKRVEIESRWLDDMRQYYGRYDAQAEAKLNSSNKSRVFANMTRTKTHAWEARLSDMLFPTDEKNWGIKPTPVPELSDVAELDRDIPKPEDGEVLEDGNQSIVDASQKARDIIEKAEKAAKAMSLEIEDQLRESHYNIRARLVIHDACKLGTGIMKGPIASGKTRRAWQPHLDPESGNVVHLMAEVEDPKPEYERVDPWSFFPDMSATTIDQSEWTYERHLYNKKDLQALARKPDFNKDEIRKLLEAKPQHTVPSYINALREITKNGQAINDDRFEVWEYHGPLEKEDIEAICLCMDDEEAFEDYTFDPLVEQRVIVWFSQGQLLKFAPHPMESGDHLYSVFAFERDDTNIFGFGVPSLMRDSQAALNGAWRMIMENAGLSVGPQVVINKDLVTPQDGTWDLVPRKIWIATGAQSSTRQRPPFELFNIPNNQEELAGIIELARRFIDEETNIPLVAQGEPGARSSAPAGTQTKGGLAMIMNSVNVVFRRVIKNFDDTMTTPNIRRIYDWNMQFNPKSTIKGDFDVDARGSSVLLVREVQAQNLMVMAMNFTDHPVLGPLTKARELYRKLMESMMIPPDDVVKTEDDERKDEELQADKPPPMELQMQIEGLNLQMELAQLESSGRIQVAEMNQETALIKLAEQLNMNADQLANKLQLVRTQTQSKERMMAVESAQTERIGPTGGGHF